MPVAHTKEFGIYHWDPPDNSSVLVAEADTIQEAENIVTKKYGNRVSANGKSGVDIVDSDGFLCKAYNVR